MHIPDAILDGKTLLAAGVLAAAGVGAAGWQARRLPRSAVPLMGLSAAFVFAAQMINFPVAGATSGHLIGGVLAAVLLGPSAAVLVLTMVLAVQCLLFADGGMLALGANVLNMAVVDAVGGYMIYRGLCLVLRGKRGRVAAAAFAAWAGAVLASVVCAGELATSGIASAHVAFAAMAGVHMLIGIGEGLITAMVLVSVWAARPELVESPHTPPRAVSFVGFGLLIAIALAVFVSPFACSWDDGLERVAKTLGFAHHSVTRAAPLADYHVPGIGSATIATACAGLVGTLIAFGLAQVLARALVPPDAEPERATEVGRGAAAS